jgi:hypothetical protein
MPSNAARTPNADLDRDKWSRAPQPSKEPIAQQLDDIQTRDACISVVEEAAVKRTQRFVGLAASHGLPSPTGQGTPPSAPQVSATTNKTV